MLHCIRAARVGGATNFVDGFSVAAYMREHHPDEFHLLSTVQYESVSVRWDVCDRGVHKISVSQEGYSDEPLNEDNPATHQYTYKFAAMHRVFECVLSS
jgi:hypothetical protein